MQLTILKLKKSKICFYLKCKREKQKINFNRTRTGQCLSSYAFTATYVFENSYFFILQFPHY